MKIKLKR